MAEISAVRVTVHGRVQGVFFRVSTARRAESLGLTGWVRNLPGGRSVQVEAEGSRNSIDSLLEYLKSGPPGAKVDKLETSWPEPSGTYRDFSIRY